MGGIKSMSSLNSRKRLQIEAVTQQLRKLSIRSVLFQQNITHALGVIQTDLKTIDILAETGPITAGELATITGNSTSSVTAILDRLEKAGFIKRIRNTQDRRKVMIILLEDKVKKLQLYYSSLSESTKEYCEKYSVDELELIIKFISDVAQIVETEGRLIRKKL